MAARLLERPEGWPDLDPYYVERLDEDPPLEYVIAAVADPDFPAQGVFRFPIDPAHPHFPYGWKVSPDTPV